MLSCKNQEYTISKGHVLLFNPGDNHACVQNDNGTLDYRGINITKEVMLDLAEEVTGKRELPGFSDQSHFTNYFYRFIGLAPGVYREIFLDKGNEQSGDMSS